MDEKEILKRFKEKTSGSGRMFREASQVTPGGVMAGIKFFEPYPLFMKRAEGSRIWDVDGNEYVDYLMSYGAVILGHGSPVVTRAIGRVMEDVGTTVTGTPSGPEIEYGSTLRDMYHREGLLRFTNSGLEATLLAVRLAKAHTGKRTVAKFEGHYHGAVDSLLFSYVPPVELAGPSDSPTAVADTEEMGQRLLSESVVLPFNDWEATESILTRRSKELACVIMEPFEEGVIPAEPRFMSRLRRVTSELGIPLIFDEVKTGFRVRLGGASEFYDVVPDITCLGKIIGGGLPMGAVVGREDILSLLDPTGNRQKRVFHSGTFNGNPLSIIVGMATVEEMRRKGRFDAVRRATEEVRRVISKGLKSYQIPHVTCGEGGMFNYYLTDSQVRNYRDVKSSDLKLRRLLDLAMIVNGVYLKPENRFCLSLAHDSRDVSDTRHALSKTLDMLTGMTRR